MAQTLLNIDMLTKESLMWFENSLEMGSKADRQYEDYYAKSGAKIGDTLRVREPVRMAAANGRALQVNNIVEKQKTITVATQKHVAWPFNSADMALSIDEYSKRYIQPAAMELASQVDLGGHALYTQVYNHVGTPGTDPNTSTIWMQAKQKLNQYSVPKQAQKHAIYNEGAEVSTVVALQGFYQDQAKIAKQYTDGQMRQALGMNFSMSQNVPKYTNGTATALGTTSAAATSGTTIAITGGTAGGTIKAGMVFTSSTCFAFNLQTRQTTGKLQQFVVQADVTLDGSGVGNLSVLPEIIVSGNYQNVNSTGVGSGDSLVIVSGSTSGGVYSQNWLFADNAIALVTADLPLVSAPKISRMSENGLSIRLLQVYDPNSDQEIFRLDILYGWAMMRPEWCCRVAGNA